MDKADLGRLEQYFEVIAAATGATSHEKLVSIASDGTDAVNEGWATIARLVSARAMHPAEAFGYLDSMKSLSGRYLMTRAALARAGLPADAVIARSDPDEVGEYLRGRPGPTAVISFYLLDDLVCVIGIANYPIPGPPGPGGTYYSVLQVSETAPLMAHVQRYASSLRNGLPDLAAAEIPLDFVGRVVVTLLGGRLPDELVFMPHREFHVLPMHIARTPLPGDTRGYLNDHVRTLRYCSSGSDLCYGSITISRLSEGDPVTPEAAAPAFLSVMDTAAGLPGVGLERAFVDALAAQTGNSLRVEKATTMGDLPSAFDHHWVNWDSHARSDPSLWGGSHLVLGRQTLPAYTIASQWSFRHRAHVVLAACQTGLDLAHISAVDEYCGLDLAFRIAGTGTVIASMWDTFDSAAAVVSMLVPAAFLQRGTPPAQTVTSLHRAMRRGNWQSALLRPEQVAALPEAAAAKIRAAQQPLWQLPPDVFADPLAWGAFRAHG